ncbi:MAG: beta-propeller fold lactonase family protein [Proteobacteria bacterium]|nr:beta-propeller fold lactonase family protein [Burkholderiales bacterium]
MLKLRRLMFKSAAIAVAVPAIGALASNSAHAQVARRGRQDDIDDDDDSRQDRRPVGRGGAVFAMTNATADNRIVAYLRGEDGHLDRVHSVSTRGLGIGVDLDTQGAVRLSRDRRFLFAVNAGSDSVSVFDVFGTRLRFNQQVDAGDQPVALALSGRLLYVLNGSVAGNGIRGFVVRPGGRLAELPNSFRALSSRIAVPGGIEFSPDGGVILVAHKTTNVLQTPQNVIDGFAIGSDGYASSLPVANESVGIRPFSLAFRNDGKLIVVEAFNALDNRSAASSYDSFSDATIKPISRSIPNFQTDSCWVEVSHDQRYAFVANFGSGTISSYRFDASGALTLIDGAAAFLGDMSQPVDFAQSGDGRFLYLLLRGTGAVAALRIQDGGRLRLLSIVDGGLPVADGASGLAAY